MLSPARLSPRVRLSLCVLLLLMLTTGLPIASDVIRTRACATAAVASDPPVTSTTDTIDAGAPVPAFEVPGLRSSETFTRDDFRDQYLLLDFWATWCGPCIEELPTLRTAYQKYKDEGFTILSLSLDRSAETVRSFARENEMSWNHALAREGRALRDRFDVTGIPKPILVAPDGTILAHDGAVRGRNLIELLDEHLGGASKSPRTPTDAGEEEDDFETVRIRTRTVQPPTQAPHKREQVDKQVRVPSLRDGDTETEEDAASTPSDELTIREDASEHVFVLTNEERTSRGRSPFQSKDRLDAVACRHNRDMLTHSYLGHEDSRGRRPIDRLDQEFTSVLVRASAENVAGRPPGGTPEEIAAGLVKQWMNSPPHRKNILRTRYTHLGACVSRKGSRVVGTQVFATFGRGRR